jgi:membrane protease YdiL (CAAX protease family)
VAPDDLPVWILRDPSGRVRAGWSALGFVLLLNGIALVFQIVRNLVPGPTGFVPRSVDDVAITLAATWALAHWEHRPLAGLGLRLGPRWFGELVVGFALACGLMAVAASGAGLAQGGWVRGPLGVITLVKGLGFFLKVALFEELIFRGYPFQRMVESWGQRWALGAMAALFVAPHLINALRQGYPPSTLAWATLNIGGAGVLLGLAFLRTSSLALPIGIHWGWNWMQGTVLGLGVSGNALPSFLVPAHPGPLASWVTGGLYGPEAGATGALAILLGIAIVRAWPTPVPPQGPA